MRILACALAAAALAGCASVIDTSAVPAATAAYQAEFDRCYTPVFRGAVQGKQGEMLNCLRGADHAFMAGIKMARTDLLASYDARMDLLAGTVAGPANRPLDGLILDYFAVRNDLWANVRAAYEYDQAASQRLAAGMMALGGGLQAAGASYNAGQYPNRTLNCTTVPLYNGASSTTCN